MESRKTEREEYEIVNKKVADLKIDFDSLSQYDKVLEFTAYLVFIESVILHRLHHGISKEESISFIKTQMESMIESVNAEVI